MIGMLFERCWQIITGRAARTSARRRAILQESFPRPPARDYVEDARDERADAMFAAIESEARPPPRVRPEVKPPGFGQRFEQVKIVFPFPAHTEYRLKDPDGTYADWSPAPDGILRPPPTCCGIDWRIKGGRRS